MDDAKTPLAHDDAERLVRRPEVFHLTGKPKTSMYRAIARGEFPAPVRIGPNAVAWKFSSIAAWIASRELARTTAAE